MTNIASLTEYVEAHPGDHEQRWRLAKKLYEAHEYTSALGHLEILRNKWAAKINVVRYLAAVYYRLDRHADSITTLARAVRTWPTEIGLREQLARVLEVADRRPEAIVVWKEVRALNPKHATVKRILDRLERKLEKQDKLESLPLEDGDFGIYMTPGRTCPACGTQNNDEYDRCWKCHTLLSAEEAVAPAARKRPVTAIANASFWRPAGVIGTVAFLATGFYLSVRYLPFLSGEKQGEMAIRTVQQLLSTEVLLTHIVLGAVLLAAWCAGLWTTLLFFNRNDVSLSSIALTGAFSASLAYAASFGPVYLIMVGYMAGLLVTALVILLGFKAGFSQGGLIWLIHTLMVTAAVMASFVAIEGKEAFLEFPAVVQYAYQHDRAPDAGRYPLNAVVPPGELRFHCESTGSRWLDGRASKVFFETRIDEPSPDLIVEVKQGDQSVYYNHIQVASFPFRCKVVPGSACTLRITGEGSPKVDVTAYGVMKVVLDN